MNTFLGYINPLPFSKRDKAIYSHLRNSTTLSSHQLLALDFEGTPKELHITAKNNKTVSIKTIFSNRSMNIMKRLGTSLSTAGYVNDPDKINIKKQDRTIYLSPILSSPMAPILSTTTLYTIGALMYQTLCLGAPVALLAPFALLAATALSSTRLAPFISIWGYLYQDGMDAIGHEHIHILQVDDHYSNKTKFDVISNIFKKRTLHELKTRAKIQHSIDSTLNVNTSLYYMDDYEIQARLHTIMTHGRQRWGRLPLTPHELWASLIDCGLTAPAKINDKLSSSSKDSHLLFHRSGLSSYFNSSLRSITDKAAAELNAATRAHILSDLKETFWTETLPYLYGHLLELYGDKNGRKLMGFDKEVNFSKETFQKKKKAPATEPF